MITLEFNQEGGDALSLTLSEHESVLDALLNAGVDAPHGCKSGVCQSCVMQANDSNIPKAAQTGLKATQIANNQFLSCSCFPTDDFSCQPLNSESVQIAATVSEITPLNEKVIKLILNSELDFKAGQFVNLWRDSTIARSYSIASRSGSKQLEFHIKRVEGGAFSDWAATHLQPGSALNIQGPMGECIYALEDKSAPILLSGIGTGLAPLLGIIRDALAQGHHGRITLILGANHSKDFYYLTELAEIVSNHLNVAVIFVSKGDIPTNVPAPLIAVDGDIYEVVKQRFNSLKGYTVFLCGAESFVKKMKKQCYLNDASLSDIHSDAFIAATP